MKTIDIKTTQNVTITYELAEVRDRIIAFIIDTIIKGLATLVLWLLYYSILANTSFYNYEEYFFFIFIFPVFILYTIVFEVLMNGQTLGKKFLKIKVIKLNGKQPGFYDYLIRWTFRILDIALSFGSIACILVTSTEFAQRLGDMASNTTVVRVNSRIAISLADILRIDTRQNYVPKYPGISNFPEEDILLIKQTLERYNRFRNDAHRKAVLLLCDKVGQKLEIPDVGPDKIGFLKTLIKDYIVLTR